MRVAFFLTITIALFLRAAAFAADEFNLPEVKVKETVINVSPKMQLYLPNGALDLNVGRKYRKTTLFFSSTYDLTDNFLGFGLDFRYDILPSPYSAGVNLFDRVDFSEFYADKEYIQRTQSAGPYVQRRVARDMLFDLALNFQRTYADSAVSLERVDRGGNVLAVAGLSWDCLEEEDIPRGGKLTLELRDSVRPLGSDYDYMIAELKFRRIHYFSSHTYLDWTIESGYPLYNGRKPLSEIYTAGGYRMLRGYGFKEFIGDALLYGTLSYTVQLFSPARKPEELPAPSLLDWNVFADAAKIGNEMIFTTPEGVKSSAGAGLTWNLNFFKYFPFKLSLLAAKAFDARPIHYYATIKTNYYTWRM